MKKAAVGLTVLLLGTASAAEERPFVVNVAPQTVQACGMSYQPETKVFTGIPCPSIFKNGFES